ncbi:hypothetical protein [Ruegeria atlantica]|nr:hypothetical protein [Ruegeria atlantica]
MIDVAAIDHLIAVTIQRELRVSSFSTLHGEVKNQEFLKRAGKFAEN